ncbi:unnamed protein product [Brassica rapa]|uniref:UVR domain-containing protein n=1 Tax=Brassica campestris TaxID=3711 RepID=A0A3P6A305_BRACM|nr:unnamed protein product [Brassica rapa]VDC81563.1 unnamed protein product [Brassica rapa]
MQQRSEPITLPHSREPSRDHFSVNLVVPRSYFTCLKSYPIHWNSNTFGLGPLKLHNKGFCGQLVVLGKSKAHFLSLDVDSVSLDENTLKQDLEAEIHEENYVEAAKIRDILKELQEYNKASVLSANTRFYQAFRNGDLAEMESLWSKSGKPCCVDELRVPVTD